MKRKRTRKLAAWRWNLIVKDLPFINKMARHRTPAGYRDNLECVQESQDVALMAAVTAARSFDKSVAFKTWIYRPIAWRLMSHWKERQASPVSLNIELGDGLDLIDLVYEDKRVWRKEYGSWMLYELCDLTRFVVAKLTPMQKEVVDLYYGLSGIEMNMSEMTVITEVTRERNRQVLADGLMKLRHEMQKLNLKSWEVLE